MVDVDILIGLQKTTGVSSCLRTESLMGGATCGAPSSSFDRLAGAAASEWHRLGFGAASVLWGRPKLLKGRSSCSRDHHRSSQPGTYLPARHLCPVPPPSPSIPARRGDHVQSLLPKKRVGTVPKVRESGRLARSCSRLPRWTGGPTCSGGSRGRGCPGERVTAGDAFTTRKGDRSR